MNSAKSREVFGKPGSVQPHDTCLSASTMTQFGLASPSRSHPIVGRSPIHADSARLFGSETPGSIPGWLKHDPSVAIRRPKFNVDARGRKEIEFFRKKWSLRTKQRLAFELFLNTGQRRSDVVRMAWSHIARQSIHGRWLQSMDARRRHGCRASTRLSAAWFAKSEGTSSCRGRRDSQNDHVGSRSHDAGGGGAIC
jgi:hypothetical protein